MKRITLALAALFITSSLAADTRRNSIKGVWRVVEEKNLWRTIDKPNPGYIIFTEKHFSVVREAQDIQRPEVTDFEKATPEQLVAMWGPFVAQFGTYEIKGDVLTLTIMVAKNKGKANLKQIERFKLEGNTLITEPKISQFLKPLYDAARSSVVNESTSQLVCTLFVPGAPCSGHKQSSGCLAPSVDQGSSL